MAAALNAFGTPLDILVGQHVPSFPTWASWTSAAVGAVILLFLLGAPRAGRQLCAVLFVVNNAAITCALWVTSESYVAYGATWASFQANKLGALSAAALAPEVVSGVVAIALFLGSAAIRIATTPDGPTPFGSGEPAVLAIYGLFAVLLLAYRQRSVAAIARTERALASEHAARAVARDVLAIRDLANTPIQTLRLNLSLLRAQVPPTCVGLLDRMDRAVDRLRGINDQVRRYETAVEWTTDTESFDPTDRER